MPQQEPKILPVKRDMYSEHMALVGDTEIIVGMSLQAADDDEDIVLINGGRLLRLRAGSEPINLFGVRIDLHESLRQWMAP